jgi:TetR/AcrR family transcriptional regulator, cholesterol catabolism regulator
VTGRGAGRARNAADADSSWSQKRLGILDASARLFASKGVDRTSMDDIGRACGLEKPSLYHYFPSKKAILTEVLSAGVDGLVSDAYAVIADGAADPLRQLERLLESHSRNFDRKLPHVKVFLLEERVLDEPERQKYLDRRREYEHIVIGVIRDGQEQGIFRAGDPTILAYGILGMFNWMVQWYDPNRRSSAEEIGQTLVAAALGAIKA